MPCIDLEHNPPAKKEIATTRSFGRPVLELHQLAEVVTEFASRAAEKLRKQSGLANQVLVFIRTSPFRPDPQYSCSVTTPLRRPSATPRTSRKRHSMVYSVSFSQGTSTPKQALCSWISSMRVAAV